MRYIKMRDDFVSSLGLGCMRLPVLNGKYSEIDQEQVQAMVDYAMDHGVNYFDTAWGYHDGRSEEAIGKALQGYDRDTWFLCSKFPGYDLANMTRIREIFPEQLRRAGVDYFDFYLFHNVCEMNIDAYLDDKYGIMDYLMEQKIMGKIHHLGFSAHGSVDVIRRFLDKYGKYMELCQIQLNYVDWSFQNAQEKVELISSYGLPVWVMEPLRGGKLASLSAEDEASLRKLRPEETVPGWAFRFLQSLPEVAVVLSGMSSMEQLKANIETFREEKPLDLRETIALLSIADAMTKKGSLPCTGCRYCTSHCPQELDIPQLISLYNEHVFTGGGFLAPMHLAALPEDKRPSACLGCHSCEQVCPQKIRISDMMKDFTARLKPEG